MRRLLLLIALGLVVGCSADEENNGNQPTDSGTESDTSMVDADTSLSDTDASDVGPNPDDFTVEFELVVDDGVPHEPAAPYGEEGGEPGSVIAVKHDPGAPAFVDSVRVPITSYGTPRAPFRVQLYEVDEDLPGEPLLAEPLAGELSANHQAPIDILWASVDLPTSLYVDGPFFVGVEYVETDTVDDLLFVGLDTDNADSLGYVYDAGEDVWMPVVDAFGYDANPGIRATIRVTEEQALQRQWRAGYSPTRCLKTNATLPFDENVGGWMAARIETPRTSFDVESIHYFLRDIPDTPSGFPPCSSEVAHRVELYVFDEDTPPADIAPVAAWDVPANTEEFEDTRVPMHHELEEPIRVDEGEFLYATVQLTENDSGRLCLHACEDGQDPDAYFWSNESSRPHTWSLFSEYFPLDLQFTVEVLGSVN